MCLPLEERLELMSDEVLAKKDRACWIAASLLLWEAAQYIRQLKTFKQTDPDEDEERIFVSAK